MKRRKFIFKSAGGIISFSLIELLIGEKSFAFAKTISKKSNKKVMNTKRMNSFDVPHKGIRNGLSQFSLMAGKVNYKDLNEVEQLNKVGKEVFLLLNTHANDENDVSLKHLEEKMKGASLHDMEEHVRIHAAQSKLEEMLNLIFEEAKTGVDCSVTGSDFYSLLADFHSDYLSHMSEEERITQQLLWDNFTDEELAGHRTEIMKKLNPETLLLWFKYIAPAQSHMERVGLFKGFKTNAPENLFKEAMKVLSDVLSEKEYSSLIKEIL